MDTVSKAQWSVMGLLLFLVCIEAIVQPNISTAITTFIKKFKTTQSVSGNTSSGG
jgi:hypothetical protein